MASVDLSNNDQNSQWIMSESEFEYLKTIFKLVKCFWKIDHLRATLIYVPVVRFDEKTNLALDFCLGYINEYTFSMYPM